MLQGADKTYQAIVVVIFTVFALALGDAIIKGMSSAFSLWQIFTLRSLIVIPVLICILRFRHSLSSLLPLQIGWTLLRSLLLTLMWVTYYVALPKVELSVAAAAYYTLPLFISLFASLFLGESVGNRGWVAMVLGFCGVLLVLKPEVTDFNRFALLPILSAILYALAMILTRSKCKHENIFVLSLWLNISMFVMGMCVSLFLANASLPFSFVSDQVFLLGNWGEIDRDGFLVIGVLSIAILIGSVGAAYAYQNGPSSTIATFDFAYVAFAVLWSIIFFNEVPSFLGSVGMVLIVTAGILSMSRRPSDT